MTCTPITTTNGGRTVRTCLELGVCQSRTPACPGCQPRQESVPATADLFPIEEPSSWQTIGQMVKAAGIAITLCAVAGLLAGMGTVYLRGAGF